MNYNEDWRWKMEEAIEERIKKRYDFIGSKSAAPFLAITYCHIMESAFLEEWHTRLLSLQEEFYFYRIDCLKITDNIIEESGVENILDSFDEPMIGSDPEADLGRMFLEGILTEIEKIHVHNHKKIVISIEKTSSLYPNTDPGMLMDILWNRAGSSIRYPIIILIPGSNKGNRKFSFLDKKEIFMYRGDLL